MNAWNVLIRLNDLQVLKIAEPQLTITHNPGHCHYVEMMILWDVCEN
jgi:hypothetical protein